MNVDKRGPGTQLEARFLLPSGLHDISVRNLRRFGRLRMPEDSDMDIILDTVEHILEWDGKNKLEELVKTSPSFLKEEDTRFILERQGTQIRIIRSNEVDNYEFCALIRLFEISKENGPVAIANREHIELFVRFINGVGYRDCRLSIPERMVLTRQYASNTSFFDTSKLLCDNVNRCIQIVRRKWSQRNAFLTLLAKQALFTMVLQWDTVDHSYITLLVEIRDDEEKRDGAVALVHVEPTMGFPDTNTIVFVKLFYPRLYTGKFRSPKLPGKWSPHVCVALHVQLIDYCLSKLREDTKINLSN